MLIINRLLFALLCMQSNRHSSEVLSSCQQNALRAQG